MPRSAKKQTQETKGERNSKWRLFDETVSEVRKAFLDVSPEELSDVIGEAVASVRSEKHREHHRNK